MVKLLIDLLDFLRSCAPLLTSLAVLSIVFILLSKSIKKHPAIYYTLFAIPFALVVIPFLGKLLGFEVEGFGQIPFLSEILRDYIHMGTFGHPLLIIIMFIGALDLKKTPVKKLMSIRKELSIIVGFAVFTHSLIRVTNNLPGAIKFFSNNAGYMAETKVVSELGAGISSFSFILGVIMLIIFIPLWITSFDKVRKRMGQANWKKFQKLAYVLYATLFIHAVGIQVGGLMNPRGGSESKPVTAIVQNDTSVSTEQRNGYGRSERKTDNPRSGGEGRPDSLLTTPTALNNVEEGQSISEGKRGKHRNKTEEQSEKPYGNKETVGSQNNQQAQVTKSSSGGRAPSKGFADIKVSSQTKGYIHLVSLILIYGSYLFLRLRKARKKRSVQKV